MRFRLCCTCDDKDEEKLKGNQGNSAESNKPSTTAIPAVVTQQPKHLEPIQLDRITEVSSDESSAQGTKESPIQETPRQESAIHKIPAQETTNIYEPPIPAPRKIEDPPPIPPPLSEQEKFQAPTLLDVENENELYKKLLDVLRDRTERTYIPPAPQPNQSSDFTVKTTIGEDELSFSRIAPDFYQGTFKGSRFHIIHGEIRDYCLAYNEEDKTNIKLIYDKAMKAMEESMQQMKAVSSYNNQLKQSWTLPSTINCNYFTRSGKEAVMTFIPTSEGQFQGTYEGKAFTLLNGQVVKTDNNFDDQDKELIVQTYHNALLGMEQGMLGMQMGMLGLQMKGGSSFGGAAMSGVSAEGRANATASGLTAYASTGFGTAAFANSSYDVLANGRETLKRMRSLNHGKRISLLEGELITQPRQPVMVIEDITENSKKSRLTDEVDGGNLTEPVLQKTTFTPNAILYDDPKTYEDQDNNEIPSAKRLDEYIISVDENFQSGNRYHFHTSRPRRVNRMKLHPKDKFRIASPERYSLFERECLKLHNNFRKIHGVPPLVHNEFLSQVAKEWAEHLALKDAFYHRPNNEYGENLYYSDGMSCCANKAVKAWYDEIDLYDYNNPKFSKETGHFTQLVWKDTREVGTGVAQIGDKVWVCCNYHPPGNYMDKFNDEFVPRPLIKAVKKN